MGFMTTREKTEVGLIATLAVGCAWLVPYLPWRISLGNLILTCSVLLLAQSLVRDLYVLWADRRRSKARTVPAMRCVCMESAVGLAGVVSGLLLLGSGLSYRVEMPCWAWSTSLLFTLVLGFALKDLVLELWPLRVRRVDNHAQIQFAWKVPAQS
jgi:hypothetical protein